MTIAFDFSTVTSGLRLEGFDFWIKLSDHPGTKDIVSNLTIWTMNHGVKNTYKGGHMTLKIGGRARGGIREGAHNPPELQTAVGLHCLQLRAGKCLE